MQKLLLILIFFVIQSLFGQNEIDITNQVENYLSSSVENGYSCSLLVAKEGKILLSKGYGWANRAAKISCTPSTVFNIGSVTKQFTATAILKLVEDGKLKLTDRLGDFYEQSSEDKKEITIHQLLTHTSGIDPATGGFRYDEASKEQFLKEFFKSELMYAPGTKHTYANANYIMLAAVIEIAANQTYESYLQENFWKPLGMNDTGYKNIDFDKEKLAHGYYFHYSSGEWKDWGVTQDYLPNNNKHWYSIGKGDVYSTIEDLYKWHKALEQNKVLTEESKKLMETAQVAENADGTSFYGYGWAIFNSGANKKTVTHNGSNGIYFADFIRLVDEDIVVIALSNSRLNQESENVAWEIVKMFHKPDYLPKPIPKNTYELVFDFMRSHSVRNVNQLPAFLEDNTGSILNDKAIMNRIGFNQITLNRNTEWGIALLKLNTTLFPKDGNLWDSLGAGYFLLGEMKLAKESFEKAVELGKGKECYWCENSEKHLKQINSN